MGTVHVHARGNFPPERFVSALTDFSDKVKRAQLWGNSQPEFLQVHESEETSAVVTEGSTAGGGIWQKSRYDWSDPHHVVLEVLDSNAFGPGSRWEYRLASEPSGGTRIDLTIKRVPSTRKGRILDLLLHVGGQLFFARDLKRSVRWLEASPASPEGGPLLG